MLVLFETTAGYALFKLLDEGKLKQPEDLYRNFESAESADKTLTLKAFSKFQNTTEALAAATSLLEGKMPDDLKSFLKTEVVKKKLTDTICVADNKLGSHISKKLGLSVISDNITMELMRGIRSQLSSLIPGMEESDWNAMSLGLSHCLSRYKLKFSPEKVDTMIVQAIGLLDDLDKELNTYSMRLKEWYGWHFPELQKILVDNLVYSKVIKTIGVRSEANSCDLSSLLPEELEKEIKEAAEISMGTEISAEDLQNINMLADQIISLHEYRSELYEYLKNRMLAIAPNLTCLVGELVGARLISHSGSLLNLAKCPASTVQILGAEKALFRALKSKHDTPKYGLIYHASIVGQAAPKLKGKISRVLAAKTSLAIRVDALGDKDTPEIGAANRLKVEERLRQLENFSKAPMHGSAKGKPNQKKFDFVKAKTYNPSADIKINEGVKAVATPVKEVSPIKEEVASPSKEKSEKKKEEKSDKKEEKKEKKDKEEKKDKKKEKRKAESLDESDNIEKSKKDKKKKKE